MTEPKNKGGRPSIPSKAIKIPDRAPVNPLAVRRTLHGILKALNKGIISDQRAKTMSGVCKDILQTFPKEQGNGPAVQINITAAPGSGEQPAIEIKEVKPELPDKPKEIEPQEIEADSEEDDGFEL